MMISDPRFFPLPPADESSTSDRTPQRRRVTVIERDVRGSERDDSLLAEWNRLYED